MEVTNANEYLGKEVTIKIDKMLGTYLLGAFLKK